MIIKSKKKKSCIYLWLTEIDLIKNYSESEGIFQIAIKFYII